MKISKIRVTNGVYWVEIADADVRMLCGCPADIVKHLIKNGLIAQQEVNGVTCETGPNAILLSDLSLQNGEFSNMAEFPVLQMLYRQGMGIPGHPNNTGAKPLLVGLAAQVNSQMHYIYRGNYGLVSKEEIVQCGIADDEAEQMMRLKRCFAFGHIKASHEFIDVATVGREPVKLDSGVSIQRLSTNVFSIGYDGETVSVDLNLASGEKYETAYALDFRKFDREYFGVIHSGEGDGWDVNRPCMSSILMFQGKIYLIDAGPNLAYTLNALGVGIEEVEGVFHTHAHDDHFSGITALMRAGRRIKYFATPLIRTSVSKKLAALLSLEEERFGDFFEVCDLQFDVWNNIEGLEVKPVFSPHPVETNIFLFRTLADEGYKSYAHFADIVSMEVLKGMVTDSVDAPGLSQQDFERTRANYLTTVDVKKIDIGGGMIHGAAIDFHGDRSGKILLAHKAQELTPEEKEVGSNAAFGAADILIPGKSDTLRRSALSYLQVYFSSTPLHHLHILLNHDIVDINPGAILLKEGEVPTEIYLVLNGSIEKTGIRDKAFSILAAGAVVGEKSAVFRQPAEHTYRAATFVQALKIHTGIYLEIIKRNDLQEKIQHTIEVRSFLESTSLFGENIPADVLTRIIEKVSMRCYQAGETIGQENLGVLNLIVSGRVERSVGSEILDTLKDRDYFGEELTVFNVPCLFHLKALDATEVYQIPGDLLAEIPVVKWKLLESYHGRAMRVIYSGNREFEAFIWRDDFSVLVGEMDVHHKKLVEIANRIMAILHSGGGSTPLLEAVKALVAYTHYHFAAEEALMEKHGYPGILFHTQRHLQLARQVADYAASISAGSVPEESDFLKFFRDWIITHILNEDRKYGEFLNSKGVF